MVSTLDEFLSRADVDALFESVEISDGCGAHHEAACEVVDIGFLDIISADAVHCIGGAKTAIKNVRGS